MISVGKISDIYAKQGITKAVKASGLEELWNVTLEEAKNAPDFSLVFTNFVDFDMTWGHRRDVEGYAQGLEYFDTRLPDLIAQMKEGDIAFITADHGCDPTYKGTDHTREHIPLLVWGRDIAPGVNLGTRETYADIAATVLDFFGVESTVRGSSMLGKIMKRG